MGNILSYFFPQPAPPSIEKVEEVVQDEKITEEVPEKTVAAKIEDAPVVDELKSSDLVVEKDIEPETPTDEGFEVVENTTLSEISNIQQNSVTQAEPEIATDDKSPVPAFNNDKETPLENKTDTTLETSVKVVQIDEHLDVLAVDDPPCIFAETSNSPPADVELRVENHEATVAVNDTPCIYAQTSNSPPDDVELRVENHEATLAVNDTPCIYAQTSNSPPDDVEVIGSIQDESQEVELPKDVSGGAEGLKDVLTESKLQDFKVKEDSPDKLPEDIVEEPEQCFGPESDETILPEVVKEKTPEPTEGLPELIKIATELSSPEVEMIGSVSDVETGSSFCGTFAPPNLQDYEMKEDSPATEASMKAESQEVELPKDVSGGAEGLKDILTESKLQDSKVKEDSPAEEISVKAASLEDELSKEVSGGVEGLKAVLKESNKMEG